jgi:1-phosphatidylinositol phosphodiesterase
VSARGEVARLSLAVASDALIGRVLAGADARRVPRQTQWSVTAFTAATTGRRGRLTPWWHPKHRSSGGQPWRIVAEWQIDSICRQARIEEPEHGQLALAVNGEADAGGRRCCRPGGGGPLEGTMDELIDHSSWMRDIPDQARLLSLSIPGTHNSCSVGGILGFTKTQDLDLPDQLEVGIRFLDVRLSHYQDNLFVHHDVVHMGKCYADILATCSNFLEQHPSETILMSIKDEGRCDSILGRFAPSRRLGKSRGDPMNWVVRSGSFEDAFKARTWEYVDDPALFYNLPSPFPGDSSLHTNLTADTRLEEVRGKIVLLRRFEADQDTGFDLTYWPENMRFRSMTKPVYAVEDHWWDPGENDKYNFMVTHMEEAGRRNPKDLYITFSSAVNLHARSYAKTINPRLNEYLAKSSRGRVGIVAMDYFQDPPALISNVIKLNSVNRATVGCGGGYAHYGEGANW